MNAVETVQTVVLMVLCFALFLISRDIRQALKLSLLNSRRIARLERKHREF